MSRKMARGPAALAVGFRPFRATEGRIFLYIGRGKPASGKRGRGKGFLPCPSTPRGRERVWAEPKVLRGPGDQLGIIKGLFYRPAS